jgi:hypothetical protein
MPTAATQEPWNIAVEQFEHFGLSRYAAQTFVALSSLGSGTARDVSTISDVPRSRVYDAAEELQEQGLVDIQEGSPKKFWAISAETVSKSLEQTHRRRRTWLREALDDLAPTERRTEQQGVWTVTGAEPVGARVTEFLLTEKLIDELAKAEDRGVSIQLAGISPGVQEQLKARIPSASLFESLWVWSDTAAGRLLMVDGEQTLISAMVNGSEERHDAPRSETAIWGQGTTNSLVIVLKAIFTWRLDGERVSGTDH